MPGLPYNCPACGGMCYPYYNYCPLCGHSLRAVAQEPPHSPSDASKDLRNPPASAVHKSKGAR
jgi:predicted amidophosphoribosyltransferase